MSLIDQADIAAKTITGSSAVYDSVPCFWSDQFDLRLQTVGLSYGFDRCITRGSIEQRSFSLLYFKNDRLIAVDAVNAKRDYVQAKKLIIGGARLPTDQLADPKMPLKTFWP